jgi:hypothetical protein
MGDGYFITGGREKEHLFDRSFPGFALSSL